ncbi:glycine dehydrogenase (decarboxylating) beta subunit [Halanaerobium saccharolyticum]|uniref:Probable glycine dehydrogenase (decarboxylating) subunit 2 n=1 Tax=Halanaerobium saccharolyticum TaxID=43595 RepID=A0A4R7YUP0_9FIRM|nr:aminomethyl-transferring glycine dehydrogenase subunit GcvPB [Halanaerobium saccharolyticum]RAK05446.1 glycine dehydrogenase (decarboxylating) beta subunit [Halanaerobium saccharolyticum]TDV99781.1 glycine dehydrogenase (decarboxylating) beta subunit [Halanaerobium saccharolyticum]TDX52003.1 glycine dehydrogenase (decarboxylating) beta subunit [Halanaerobium saccharolyticum]
MEEKLIKDYSSPGRKGYSLPPLEVEKSDLEAELNGYLREELELPEVSEVDVVRHYTALSEMNYGVDSGIYPLGSCTMKYNPKRNERVARTAGLTNIHPYQPEEQLQGSLEILYQLKLDLAEISAMDEITLQPASGAHGEFVSLMIVKKYFEEREENRTKVIVPDSAHGTNPASATMAGFEVVEIASNERGMVDLDALAEALDEKTAALMLTNPNTLGIFEEDILKITEMVHQAGGLVYYDGANMNAIMGYAKPGLMDFDLMHFNLHKTFSTPHGGGGPGSGPVGVKDFLAPYLPRPLLKKDEKKYYWDYQRPKSIGKVHSFYGNYGVMLRAWAYIKTLGGSGLKKTTENAVLNANYLKARLKKDFELPYAEDSLHEFVLSGSRQKEEGASTLQIAKRLLDYDQYAPTIYFPLVVKEAMMIEPTETENIETLDHFVETMLTISREIKEDPELVNNAPHSTTVRKLDETKAARNPDLHW